MGILLLLKVMSKMSSKIVKAYEFLAKLILFNLILRFVLEGYMEFAINSLINMKFVSI